MAFTKMLWELDTPIQLESWDFWQSIIGTVPINWRVNIVKCYNKIAYYAVFKFTGGVAYNTLFISPDQDAVLTREGSNYASAEGTVTDVNNTAWYYGGHTGINVPLFDDSVYIGEFATKQDAAQSLLDRIYAVPFHEDYQNAQYTLGRTDKERTIRKALGLWLAFTTSNYSNPNVQYISDNADTIIATMVNKVSSSTDIRFYIYARYSNVNRGVYLNLYYANNASDIVASIVQKYSYRGLEYYTASAISPQPPFTNLYSLYIDAGSPTVTETTGTYYFNTIGMYSTSLYDKDTTNFGVDY